MVDGPLVFSPLHQDVAVVVFDDQVIPRHRQGVLKQRVRVAPSTGLNGSDRGEKHQRHRRNRDHERSPDAPPVREFSQTKNQHDEESDGWNVVITIRHRLADPNRHKTDDGNERSHEPQPSHDQPGPRHRTSKRNCRDDRKRHDGNRDPPDRRAAGRKRIVNRQIRRPERQKDVLGVRHQRISHARGQRGVDDPLPGSDIRLGKPGHDHGSRHHAEQRQLLANQR